MKQPNNELVQARIWGCPTYILDPNLQDGSLCLNGRSGLAGQSLDHHTTVGKILNFTTGFVSPQFHCVYDELFTSCFGTVTDKVFDKSIGILCFNSVLSTPPTWIQSLQTLPDASKLPVFSRTSSMSSDILTMSPLLLLQFLREMGPFLPLQIGDEGTSDSEGDAHDDSEGAPANEGAPDSTEQAVPLTAPPPTELPRPAQRRGIRLFDELDQRATQPKQRSTRRALAPELKEASTHPMTRRSNRAAPDNDDSARALPARSSRCTRNPHPMYAGKGIYHYTPEPNGGRPRHTSKHHQCMAGGCGNRQVRCSEHENAPIHGLNWEPSALVASAPDSSSKQILHDLLQNTPLGDWTPLALQAKLRSKDPDTPGCEEAMNDPYAAGYKDVHGQPASLTGLAG